MSRIAATFENLARRGEKGLITFLTGGDPDLGRTRELILAMDRAGADLIEIGIPFSDPVADGPVIQAASVRALAAGVTVKGILDTVEETRKDTDLPIVFMTYYNPVFQFGLEAFCQQAAHAGADGLIVPDLPLEESGPLRKCAHLHQLDLIPLVAPTSTPARIAAISRQASGFIYCVAVTGVTGMRETIETDLEALSSLVRRNSALPLAIGFGVSGPESAARVSAFCDAVVVGSSFVRLIGEGWFGEVEKLTSDIKAAMSSKKKPALGPG